MSTTTTPLPVTTNWIGIKVDRDYYTPGDTVNGTITLHIAKPVKTRGLIVNLHGYEKTHIPSGKYTVTSTNEMMKENRILLQNQTLNPGDQIIPFQSQLPPNALPSNNEWTAEINWIVSAKLDIPLWTDVTSEHGLCVYTVSQEKSVPVSFVNPETSPKIQLDLPGQVYQPGEKISGKLSLVTDNNLLRTVRVKLVKIQSATAESLLASAKDDTILVREYGPIPVHELSKGPVTFELDIPRDATTSYEGKYSMLQWKIEIILDLPFHRDNKLHIPIIVAIRKTIGIPSMTLPSTEQVVIQTKNETVETPTSAGTNVEQPTRMLSDKILLVLANGDWKDVLTISNELVVQGYGYVDIDAIEKTCQELVNHARVETIGEGTFSIKYRLIR